MTEQKIKRVYLDYAAATPLDRRVKEAMEPYFGTQFGNAGGLYEEGRRAKEALTNAREILARAFGGHMNEVIFTSGGTESDNLAIFGVAYDFLARQARNSSDLLSSRLNPPRNGAGSDVDSDSKQLEFMMPHIITTTFEHHAVLEPIHRLEKEGFRVTYLNVGEDGIVNPRDVEAALCPETILVSVMYANNEIGTIQPIAEIGKVIKKFRQNRVVAPSFGGPATKWPFFHTDACQAAGYLDINANNLGVDLMTINAAKIYGPKGVGALYRRNSTSLKAQVLGGGQEMRIRGGTENIPLVVGFAKALEIAQNIRQEETKRLTELRDYFIKKIIEKVPKVVLNGHPHTRLPNNVNVSILDIEGEALVLYLDAKGVSFSTGSACTSESLDPSHVILALGKPYEFAHSSMRFTMGRETTKDDIDYVLSALPKTVEWLRTVSPISIEMNAKSMSHPEAFAGQNLRVKAKGKSYK